MDTPAQTRYEEFCDNPACVECHVSMELHDGCEWPEDERLWRCDGCMAALASKLLSVNERIQTERDAYRMMAGELIAAIRMNSMRGTFAACTHNDIEEWLKPWVARLTPSPSAPSASPR